jgi:hypothetical protein
MQTNGMRCRVGAAILAVVLVTATPALAAYNLKLSCKLTKKPIGSTLVPDAMEIEVDTYRLKARVRDEVIEEVTPGGIAVNKVDARKGKVKLVYELFPQNTRWRKDTATGNAKSRKIVYDVSCNRNTKQLILLYHAGRWGVMSARATGTCAEVN